MSGELSPEEKFSRTASAAASTVITSYSTSFGWASRLLGRRHRHHVRNIYAMVRVADEIVDGAAAGAGLDGKGQQDLLDEYQAQTHRAVATGYSSDLVLHAFARTARCSGIGTELIDPFFASMRADLSGSPTTPEELRSYVYGSAEAVGLMCLQVFLREEDLSEPQRAYLTHGARQLGAAFQHVNFLRDLAEDQDQLGRHYLATGDRITPAEHARWIRQIRHELDEAAEVIPYLPRDCRAAVSSAHMLFSELLRRLARTDTDTLYRQRVRVPHPVKAQLVARATAGTMTAALLRRS